MKNNLTTLLLLLGVLLLGAFIWFFERHTENSGAQERRERTVFAVYPETIDFIRLERDDVRMECARQSGVWRLVYPTDAPVDQGVVEKMIAGMARVERGERITARTLRDRGLTTADYGFDPPRARITFKNNHGTFTWLIGRDAPLGNMLYVMSEDGNDIIAAPRALLNLVPQDPAWIRDRTLFHGEIATVRGLDLRRPAGFLQLRRTEQNGWMMQQPRAGRAGSPAIHALLEKVFAARIGSFVTDTPSDLTVYGLEEPAYELTLFAQDESTQTLRIGKAPPDQPDVRFAKWVEKDSVFTVPAAWLAEMDLDAATLRDVHLLGIQPEAVTALNITQGERRVELVRSNGTWSVTRPARWAAEPARVNELLQSLIPAAVAAFVDDPDTNRTALIAAAPWVFELNAGDALHTLRISAEENGQRLAQPNQEPSFCVVSGEIVRDEFADPLFYRNRTVLEIDPGQIDKITVRIGETEQSAQKNREGSFLSTDPVRRTDSEALTGLFRTLSRLNAERYAAFNPASLEPYGLAEPAAEVSVVLTGTNTIGRILLIGNETADGRFAMLQGQNIVFVLSGQSAQTLTRELTQPAAGNHD
jgi:hypothetical protein